MDQALRDAHAAHKAGDLDRAIAGYRAVLRMAPRHAGAHHLYGVALQQKGDAIGALHHIEQALALAPSAALYRTLALLHLGAARYDAMLEAVRSGLAFANRDADLYALKGRALVALGDADAALAAADAALDVAPDHADALLAKMNAQIKRSEFSAAAATARAMIAHHPGSPHGHANLGLILLESGRPAAALEPLAAAIDRDSHHAQAHDGLANAYQALKDYERALRHSETAVALRPGVAQLWHNRANLLRMTGQAAAALDCHARAMRLAPDSALIHSSQLYTLHCVSGIARADIYAATRRWAARFCPSSVAPRAVDYDTERPLRIGLVSHGFRRHPVGYLTLAAFEHLDRDEFLLFGYSDLPPARADDMTARFQARCTAWREIVKQPDSRVGDFVRQDRIDILINLTGHGEGSRMGLFCQKPAPVQVEWVGGLFDTSGLDSMDWLLGDPVQVPDGEAVWYTERVYRLPDIYVCYTAPSYCEPVAPLPAGHDRPITFGSFNNLAKLSDGALDLWAGPLQALPDSRLLISASGADAPAIQTRLTAQLAARGIDPGRLRFAGMAAHADFLARYHQVDIALDSHPYSGGLTTIEALLMGVPVATVPGETFAGRHAAAHLHAVGLADWVCADAQSFTACVLEKAQDRAALARLRASLRGRLLASPLTDAPRFARHLRAALRRMWQVHCQEAGASQSLQ